MNASKAKHIRMTTSDRTENGMLIGKFEVFFNQKGELTGYVRENTRKQNREKTPLEKQSAEMPNDVQTIQNKKLSVGSTWYAFLENVPAAEGAEPGIDMLDFAAVAEALMDFDGGSAEEFLKQFRPNEMPKLQLMQKGTEYFLPWTLGLDEDFQEAYGYVISDFLPEIIWKSADEKNFPTYHRENYLQYVGERMEECCYGQLQLKFYCNSIRPPQK